MGNKLVRKGSCRWLPSTTKQENTARFQVVHFPYSYPIPQIQKDVMNLVQIEIFQCITFFSEFHYAVDGLISYIYGTDLFLPPSTLVRDHKTENNEERTIAAFQRNSELQQIR